MDFKEMAEAENHGSRDHAEDNPDGNITSILSEVTQSFANSLQKLEKVGPRLAEVLHHERNLPEPSHIQQAARAVDMVHKIQVLLDPPVLILADHFLGYVRTQCLRAAVESGVPDALEGRDQTLEELAKATNSRADRLGQILRILVNSGIFCHDDVSGRYSNSPASLLLQSDHWTQWHNWVRLYGNQFYDIARGIPESIHEGAVRTAAQINYDTDDNMFSFFRSQNWVPQLHKTLGGGAAAQMPGILADYPWHEVSEGLVMDVGGGTGAFLAGLLRHFPTMQGGIFDLPHIIDHVREIFQPGGQYSDLAGRVHQDNLVAGNFLERVPACEVYTMKWCLHDWRDADVVKILTRIRERIVSSPRSRLIILESNLSNDHSERLSQYGDINMMMTANGQERSKEQWTGLAERAGWRITRVCDLRRAWVKAIELRVWLEVA